MMEARLYEKKDDKKTLCHLCEFRCNIADGKYGICGVRQNIGGTLFTRIYGKLVAQNIDPIEKKPLFHFLPGSTSYSIATVGCNFRCLHCQNSEISQMPREEKGVFAGRETAAKEVVESARAAGCESISYTYTEPTIFFEFAYDTAKTAKENGIKNVFVTNGYMTPECLKELGGLLDAANVDLKSFSDDFYKKVCGARLKPVLESIERMKKMGIWVEITTLIIPTLNDSEDELAKIAKFISGMDNSIPWHVSAFHPAYKLRDLPRTPASKVLRAREIGLEHGLKYVYSGNIPGEDGESTYCYNCKEKVIDRLGFFVKGIYMKDGACAKCGARAAGRFK